MFPFTAGARPGNRNMMSLPNSASSRLLPDRKPSPTPTSSNRDPTPQAIPNMVRNERSLCAHKLRKICAKMSSSVRMISSGRTLQSLDAHFLDKNYKDISHKKRTMPPLGSPKFLASNLLQLPSVLQLLAVVTAL